MGMRTKNRKSPSVQLDYLFHVQEVKPWPPSHSLRTLRSVVIQWEYGGRNSGFTNPIVPSLGSGIGDGKIEFNESFRLPVTLFRQMSTKGGEGDNFQKNCVEFNLYEPRRDKTLKGQLLGTATIDLAEYGIVKGTTRVCVPVNSKRSFSTTAQPVLFINIQAIEKCHTSSPSRDNLSKEASMERQSGESVSALMNEECAEEAEIASTTDDDVSSHSSLAVSSPALDTTGGVFPNSEQTKNGLQTMKDNPEEAGNQHHWTSKKGLAKLDVRRMNGACEILEVRSSCSSSTDLLSSDIGSVESGHATLSNLPETSLTLMPSKIATHSVQSSTSSLTYEGIEEEVNTNMRSEEYDCLMHEVDEMTAHDGNEINSNSRQRSHESKPNGSSSRVASPPHQVEDKLRFESQVNPLNSVKVRSPSPELMHRAASDDAVVKDRDRKEYQENEQGAQISYEGQHCVEDEPWNRFSQDDTRKQVSPGSDALYFGGDNVGVKGSILSGDRLKLVKSVRSSVDSGRINGSIRSGKLGDTQNVAQGFVSIERKDTKVYPKETRNINSDGKIQQLERRIRLLEGELREAAAIEVGLYSVVAEHGSSINKVHAPARRLSRLYLYACKESSQSRRATAARSAVSGLVLVAKACGNDVPRLTFWLSNSVVLRAIISRAIAEQQLSTSVRPCIEKSGGGKGNDKKLSPLNWKEFSLTKGTKGSLCENFGDWEDPCTFTSALEKFEAWIFSRIIESVWWQTLTPHMQPAAAKAISTSMASDMSKTYRRTSSSVDEEQANFSLELWKKAFKDAFERLCPVRAGGHECGCLPVLARLIMEQCVARLDVAMFNAILRESDDEIPTDPVSDPICDAKVLPIPAGKSSFGAGAQLKNAIGNWSRWLTDVFGIDDDDSFVDKNDHDNDDDMEKERDTSFKSFHLLKALSDLMMLPKDMLLSRSIRKEVCPTFGAPIIKRVLDNFLPDEFCPDPIPDVVLEALDSEDAVEVGEGSITNSPCTAAPIVYLPPPAALAAGIIGEIGSQSHLRRNGSSVLRKSYTSDDELDELDSPLTAIIDSFQASPTLTKSKWISKENGSQNAIRYQLLREVWMNIELQ
ncbi:hypothetical protein U1Q18_043552 [Sarracenia purpurea var. burkii]